MFWRERMRENREENGGPPSGQVRVLVVGDSDFLIDQSIKIVIKIMRDRELQEGVGKTSLVHLIMTGSSIAQPPQTIGCSVSVKHITYGSSTNSSNNIRDDSDRDFFVELWDISGHERYKECQSLFYSQINGVVFVHDLSQRRTKISLNKWAAEISATGTFSAPLSSGGPGGLPVPYIVIGNKADISAKEGARGSSGSLVDVARQWVGRQGLQGLLPSSEELPLAESFPSSGGLLASAKEARYDKEALMKFFRMLIRRRYFPDELSGSTPWSAQVNRTFSGPGEISSDEDQQYKNSSTLGQPYKYDGLPPLPAQHNLTPPPTLYPQQPMSKPDSYNIPRFALANSEDIARTRSRRMDINV
ncbi:small GTPase LIP1-like isoform X1 [Salvia miltiorrhiza]|uniref:small GTPase LIP1-like isoform X1 n=1 Tax=Salvia miltiorrhiza TaxID=226208 RepID=UPI0025ABFF31|nr:small GTPase LIP1-like isoform X1 [Salvia miltiorrhiza]